MPRTPDQYQELKDKRRAQLMYFGLKSFGGGTYKDVKVSDIAKTAKCSHGLFFHYFEDKEAFFSAIWKELIFPCQSLPTYDQYRSLKGSKGLQELCKYFDKIAKMDAKTLLKMRIYVLYPLDPAIEKTFPKLFRGLSFKALLKTLLKEAQEEGVAIAGPIEEIVASALLLFNEILWKPTVIHGGLIYNLLTKSVG